MGCSPLFCCFRNYRPNCIALTALITSIISLAFLIWGLADLHWFRKGEKVLYIIGFILIALIFISLICILILLNFRNTVNYITFNSTGKILCLLIIAFCIIAFILFLIAEILILKHYSDYESDMEKYLGYDYDIPSHDWAAAILPGFLTLIATVIIALCANVLYTIFNDNIVTSVLSYQPNPVLNQNSMTTIPNVTSPSPVIITGNNAGVVPPPIVNNPQNFPVYVSGTNLNMK